MLGVCYGATCWNTACLLEGRYRGRHAAQRGGESDADKGTENLTTQDKVHKRCGQYSAASESKRVHLHYNGQAPRGDGPTSRCRHAGSPARPQAECSLLSASSCLLLPLSVDSTSACLFLSRPSPCHHGLLLAGLRLNNLPLCPEELLT